MTLMTLKLFYTLKNNDLQTCLSELEKRFKREKYESCEIALCSY